MIARLLERKGATVQAWGGMYKELSQSILLYGREIWVVTREMLKLLTVFRHRAARQIMGMTSKRGAGREWEYPVLDDVMDTTGVHPIVLYIKR